MSAGTYDFTIERGTTHRRTIKLEDAANQPVDLTGYDARLQIRNRSNVSELGIALDVAGGGITIGGAAGTIDLYISDADTSALSISSGVYALELIDAEYNVSRLLQGTVKISGELTI